MSAYLSEFFFSPPFVFFTGMIVSMIVILRRANLGAVSSAALLLSIGATLTTFAYLTDPAGNRWIIYSAGVLGVSLSVFIRKRVDAAPDLH